MAVTGVSHASLLIELGPICISIEASLLFKSCEDHSLLRSYNGGLWKTFTGLSPMPSVFFVGQSQTVQTQIRSKRGF